MLFLIFFITILCLSMPTSSSKVNFKLRLADYVDFPTVAKFLSSEMYSKDIRDTQRRELSRLELKDIKTRYRNDNGKLICNNGNGAGAMIIAEEDSFVVGCVGIDLQILDKSTNKISKYDAFINNEDDEIVVPILANLAVKRERRRQGIAKALLKYCDSFVQESNYNELYLLVNEENISAYKLYNKSGYKKVFSDEDATCVVPGEFNLRTESCTNICMKKTLSSSSSRMNPQGLLGNIFSGFKF